jgi:transposase
VLLRLAYLGVSNAFALLRLLPMSNRDKDAEILALRHQLAVLQRQLGPRQMRFTASDRALLAALLHRLPSNVLQRLHLVVKPDTVLRWHRYLRARRHAERSRPTHVGRPRTVRSIRTLVLRLVHENPGWGHRRVHGELLVLGVKVAASTVWEILQDAGINPAPERSSNTWADFLRTRADVSVPLGFANVCAYEVRSESTSTREPCLRAAIIAETVSVLCVTAALAVDVLGEVAASATSAACTTEPATTKAVIAEDHRSRRPREHPG